MKRIEKLLTFSLGIIEGKNGSVLYREYAEVLDSVNAGDALEIVDELVRRDIPMEKLKRGLDKIFNVFYKPLVNSDIKLPVRDTFLYYLVKENKELNERLKAIRPLVKKINRKNLPEKEAEFTAVQLRKKILDLGNFESHYLKKENILFPYLEKAMRNFRCIQVMWSYHDDIRTYLKQIISELDSGYQDLKKLNKLIGELFFSMRAMRFREEYVLFPVALEKVDKKHWDEMYEQGYEIGYSYINIPGRKGKIESNHDPVPKNKGHASDEILNINNYGGLSLDLGTGKIDLEQIIGIFNSLPVDLTFVDKNNKVRYFSSPEERIFPRSKAIIGRDVENCHPPESVHIVKEIIEAFRSGKKKSASFWIELKGKFILIQYFALNDRDDNYIGVLEVSQDVTKIRNLKGEKRLLDW